jgi:hypothetical protein
MSVSVYKGKSWSGQARRAGSFKDGIYIAKVEVVAGGLLVTDPVNTELYHSGYIPELEGYAVQSISCNRSAQSGRLVVTIGGFYAGTSGQQSLVIATDYDIREEVTHEQYTAGQR